MFPIADVLQTYCVETTRKVEDILSVESIKQ